MIFYLTFTLLHLTMSLSCQGFDFTMDRREYLVKNQTYCGLLRCQADTASDTQMAGLIKMDIYYLKNEKLLATMLSENSEIQTHTGNKTKVIGSMSKDHGEFHVYFSDVSICSEAAFICKIHFKNSTQAKEIEEKVILPMYSDQSKAKVYVQSQISIENKIFDKSGEIMKNLKSFTSCTNEGTGFSFTLGNPGLVNADEESMQGKKPRTISGEGAENNFEQKLSDLEVKIRTQLQIFMNQISSKMEDITYAQKEINTKFNELTHKDFVGRSEHSISAIIHSQIDRKLSTLERRLDDIVDRVDQVNISLHGLKRSVNDNDDSNDLRNKTDQTLSDVMNNLEELKINQMSLEALLVNVSTALKVHLAPDKYNGSGDDHAHKNRLKCEKGMSSALGSRVIASLDNKKQVLCDTETDGGGWIIIQRRVKGDIHFNRNWKDYKEGFGSLNGDFWLGNEIISNLTTKDNYRLRIDMRSGVVPYNVSYDFFMVAGESMSYTLRLGGFSGKVRDSLGYHNHMPFSAPDRDNDKHSGNCAKDARSGWWYNACFGAHLNGDFDSNLSYGMKWLAGSNYLNFNYVEMKIRRG